MLRPAAAHGRPPLSPERRRAVAAVAALLLAACREAPEPPPLRPVVRVQGEAIDLQRALDHVRALAAAPRPTGTPAEARAAEHIEKVLAAEGYRI